MRVSKTCHTGHIPDRSWVIHHYVQGHLFVREGLYNKDTVAKANSYRNDADLYLFRHFFSSFPCHSSFPPPHSLSHPSLQPTAQLSILLYIKNKTSHPLPLFLHLCSRSLGQTSALKRTTFNIWVLSETQKHMWRCICSMRLVKVICVSGGH